MWPITLPIENNSSTVKHTAAGVTLHQNIFGVRFDPIQPDVLVNVSCLIWVKVDLKIILPFFKLPQQVSYWQNVNWVGLIFPFV